MQLELEHDALLFCLAKRVLLHPPPSRDRYRSLVQERSFTGAGFLTTLEEDASLVLLDGGETGDIAQMGARLNGNPNEIGVVIMAKEGRVVWIEGFLYFDDPWPDRIESFELFDIHLGRHTNRRTC